MNDLRRRLTTRAMAAGDIVLAMGAVWLGLDAYFLGHYELATAAVFALVWAVAGLAQIGLHPGGRHG